MFKYVICKIKSFLSIPTQCTYPTPIYDKMVKQLEEIKKSLLEVKMDLQCDKELLIKELKKKDIIFKAMIEQLPDMLWFKDSEGKYIYANKAIRKGLLFDCNPIGKADVEIAKKNKEIQGNSNFTFGEVCGNSDKDMLENQYTCKEYVESGKVKGKMLHLAVNKTIVKLDGEILGVAGSGRDITIYREKLLQSNQEDVFKINEFENKDIK